MTTKVQSGVIVPEANGPWTIVSDLPVPVPGEKQVLVKSIVSGVNPVEMFLRAGVLVTAWPSVMGCDASGVVMATGPGCRLQVGDHVCGCTRVGQNQYMTFQDTFLMDDDLAFKVDGGTVGFEAAATVGVGLMTAGLALIAGCGFEVPINGTAAPKNGEWIVVLGSTGAVGQFGVQLAKLCGYSVLAGCSKGKESVPLVNGATATFDSRAPVEDQLVAIEAATDGGNGLVAVFDASAASADLAIKALTQVSSADKKSFATVDDWSPITVPDGINDYRVHLGQLGREDGDDPFGKATTAAVRSFVPALEAHLAKGTLRPLEYEIVGGVGYDAALKGIGRQEKGGLKKKLVVRVQAE